MRYRNNALLCGSRLSDWDEYLSCDPPRSTPPTPPTTQSSAMGLCKILSVRSIVCRLCKSLRRRRQRGGASEESLIVVDVDQVSQTAESSSPPPSPSVDEGSGPRHADDIQQAQPPLPSSCNKLQPGDVKILGNLPSRAGAFADVWDGDLAGDPVVVKSYRTYFTTDSTQARMVRHCWYIQPLRFVDLPSVTETL